MKNPRLSMSIEWGCYFLSVCLVQVHFQILWLNRYSLSLSAIFIQIFSHINFHEMLYLYPTKDFLLQYVIAFSRSAEKEKEQKFINHIDTKLS